MDICPAKNGLCPSKNKFDRTTWPAPAGKLFQALLGAFYIVSMPLQYLKERLKNLEKRKEKFTIHRINPRETS